MSSSSSLNGLRAFVEGVRDARAGHGPRAVAGAGGALGAALASMALRALADEGGDQAPYHEGRAHELGELAERLVSLESARADSAEERAEAALETAETALAALRLLHLGAPPEGSPGEAFSVAGELLRAAVAAGAACAEACSREIDDPSAAELRRSTAALLARRAVSPAPPPRPDRP